MVWCCTVTLIPYRLLNDIFFRGEHWLNLFFSCDVGQLRHWEDDQKWSTHCVFSASCLICQTEVAGDMGHVVSVPMGLQPEPACSTMVDFSPLLAVGITEVAAAVPGLGLLSIFTQLHPPPWCCLGKAHGCRIGIRVLTNTESKTLWTRWDKLVCSMWGQCSAGLLFTV